MTGPTTTGATGDPLRRALAALAESQAEAAETLRRGAEAAAAALLEAAPEPEPDTGTGTGTDPGGGGDEDTGTGTGEEPVGEEPGTDPAPPPPGPTPDTNEHTDFAFLPGEPRPKVGYNPETEEDFCPLDHPQTFVKVVPDPVLEAAFPGEVESLETPMWLATLKHQTEIGRVSVPGDGVMHVTVEDNDNGAGNGAHHVAYSCITLQFKRDRAIDPLRVAAPATFGLYDKDGRTRVVHSALSVTRHFPPSRWLEWVFCAEGDVMVTNDTDKGHSLTRSGSYLLVMVQRDQAQIEVARPLRPGETTENPSVIWHKAAAHFSKQKGGKAGWNPSMIRGDVEGVPAQGFNGRPGEPNTLLHRFDLWLSPTRVLLAEEGVVLADFGLAGDAVLPWRRVRQYNHWQQYHTALHDMEDVWEGGQKVIGPDGWPLRRNIELGPAPWTGLLDDFGTRVEPSFPAVSGSRLVGWDPLRRGKGAE